MKSIECDNFVSYESPNIILVGDIRNSCYTWKHLELFGKTHNIYSLYHDTTNHFEWYNELPSKHNEIISLLDKHNLKKFILSSWSFGAF